MKQGFLWYDNDPKKDMASKVSEAISRYAVKFGAEPAVCYVNPIHAGKLTESRVKVLGSDVIQPNHVWIEIEK